jgi:hypothetical protein
MRVVAHGGVGRRGVVIKLAGWRFGGPKVLAGLIKVSFDHGRATRWIAAEEGDGQTGKIGEKSAA